VLCGDESLIREKKTEKVKQSITIVANDNTVLLCVKLRWQWNFTDFQCKPTASIIQGRNKIAYLEDGGRRVLRKVDEFLSAYKFSHPERQRISQSPL